MRRTAYLHLHKTLSGPSGHRYWTISALKTHSRKLKLKAHYYRALYHIYQFVNSIWSTSPKYNAHPLVICGLILVNKFNVEYFALEEAILLKLFVFSAVKRRKIENKVINPAINPLTKGRDPFQLSVQIVQGDQGLKSCRMTKIS